MRPVCHLAVEGADPHHLLLERLESLQELVTDLGAQAYPLFLRLGSGAQGVVQPVVSGELLAEVRTFSRLLQDSTIPCLIFQDEDGTLLGGLYAAPERRYQPTPKGTIRIAPAAEGIRAEAALFPPPVGFRSREGLDSGRYECYFQYIEWHENAYRGWRTPAMGGSKAPVPLPDLRLPPATRWDFAHSHGKPKVARVELAQVPFPEAFQEILHAVTTACEDSLRLKVPLEISRDG